MTIFTRCILSRDATLRQMRCLSSINTRKNINEVRVRFAPSPTGSLHIGGLRTAFYNYVFARQNGGKFVLRIEDTDRARTISESAEEIEQLLTWAGLRPDESPILSGEFGPYRQSERVEIYAQRAKELIETGRAYKCFCSSHRLDLLRKFQAKNREKPRYDGKCRHLKPKEIEEKLEENHGRYAIRFALVPGTISFSDIVFGDITTDLVSSYEGDFVIIKSDGYPTYHFANVVDDHAMEISHVMRGSEWISSTAKHIQIYRAFGWNEPEFAHFPLITLRDGSKISKRDNQSQVKSWIYAGYEPLGLLNFLTNMGGGVPKSKQDSFELWDIEKFIQHFRFDEMTCHPASVDLTVLNKYNAKDLAQQWAIDRVGFLNKFKKSATSLGFSMEIDDSHLENILQANIDRISTLNELLVGEYSFLWTCPRLTFSKQEYESKNWDIVSIIRDVMDTVDRFGSHIDEKDWLATQLRLVANKNEVIYSDLMQFIRKSLTNSKNGLPVQEIIQCLGRDRALMYLNKALEYCR